jgi:YVTN family beta-propeller protein
VAYTLVLANNTLIPGNFNSSGGSAPVAATYDAGKSEVFVANLYSNNVSVISDGTDRVVASVPVGSYPQAVTYDSGKGEVYVADSFSDNVSVISDATNSVVASVPVGSSPYGLAYDPGKGEVFVTNFYSDNVSVISDATNTVLASIPVGSYPAGVVYDAASAEVFVTNLNSNNVSVISDATNTVVATVVVGTGPYSAAYDGGKGEVFVPNYYSDNVSVISDTTNAVVASTPTGSFPYGVAYDGGMREVFVTNLGSDNVSVVSDATNAVVTNLPVGSAPEGLAYDSGKESLYDCNSQGGTISIISDGSGVPHNVTFTETGLPSGTNWSVTLNGSTASSTSSVIALTELNGTYPYLVGPVPGYAAVPSSGNVTVSGGSVNQPITFTRTPPPTYLVTFAESGLVPGTSWSVTLNGTPLASSTSSVMFTELNGTYPFTVGSLTGYTATPSSGTVTVSGGPVNTSVAFVSTVVEHYAVTFSEAGLPSGTSWTVTLNGTPNASTSSSAGFLEPNGTYSFTIGSPAGFAASPSVGSVTVNGRPANQSIEFGSTVPGRYAVTFTEVGLPSGASWAVTLNGTLLTSTTSTVVFSEPNGTYSFTLGSVAGYAGTPSTGTVTVSGGPAGQAFAFTSTVSGPYVVTFTESGLPAGTSWSVTLAGAPHTSTISSLTFTEPNGTYSFTVGSVSGYSATPATGSVVVSGAGVSRTIGFGAISVPGPSSGFLGLPGSWGYYLLIVVLIEVVAVVVLAVRARGRKRVAGPGPPRPPPSVLGPS